jgi:hypothetical protein
MSIEPTASRKPISGLQAWSLAAMAVGVLAMQVAVPWFCIHSAGPRDESYEATDASPGNGFWNRRLRFESFLNPGWFKRQSSLTFASGTVCEDELIVLLKTEVQQYLLGSTWTDPSEVLHINLRTGRISSSPAPSEARHVLSDGHTLWWLPELPRSEEPPFLLEGRPFALGQLVDNDRLTPLIEFVDGRWRKTDRFALLPYRNFNLHCTSVRGQLHLLMEHFEDDIWYRTDLEIGTEVQAREFKARYGNWIEEFTEQQLRETGWRHVHHDHYQDGLMPGIDNLLDYWFEGGIPAALSYIHSDDSPAWTGFVQHRYSDDVPTRP